MYLLLVIIVLFWIFSIYVFSKWRFSYVLKNQGTPVNPTSDWATNLFVKGISLGLLLLIFFLAF